MARYGLQDNGPVAGMGGNAGYSKPFSGYTPPNGYSPWMGLYQPTNGSVDPYTAYVQPALSQQNFNAHVSEQIQGVRPMMPGYARRRPASR